MKFYDEEAMSKVQNALEAKVLRWRGVKAKEMMGCRCYFYGTKFFAFLVTNGLVITKLPEDARVRLTETHGGEPFEMSGRSVKTWVRVPVKRPVDITAILPFVKTSYETAIKG